MLFRQDNVTEQSIGRIATQVGDPDGPYDVICCRWQLSRRESCDWSETRDTTVLRVDRRSEGCLGGTATHRGVLSYCGMYSVEPEPRRAVGRIWTEIHSRLVSEGAASELPEGIVAPVQVR